MLTLINTNRTMPPIAPIGLDYLAAAVRAEGYRTDLVDLCLADDPGRELAGHFSAHRPDLVGLSLRNVDDCFLAGSSWFVPDLSQTVERIRALTDAMRRLKISHGMILADANAPTLEADGLTISICSTVEWLINQE